LGKAVVARGSEAAGALIRPRKARLRSGVADATLNWRLPRRASRVSREKTDR